MSLRTADPGDFLSFSMNQRFYFISFGGGCPTRNKGWLMAAPLGVKWLVFQQFMECSAKQSAAFNRIEGDNHRNTQPGNDRAIVADTTIDVVIQ